jgi:hypothetical protein
VGLGVAPGGLTVAVGAVAVAVGAVVADGAVVPRGAAVPVWRPEGEAGARVEGGTGAAGWVVEWAGVRAAPPTCAGESGRTSR